ncbi:MAG: hypothetical protein HDS25_08105 [Bacteroides sp.]|nr:hypothetical protein [Bacteroides sp.]MDE6235875.1 hypothetical protein [Muribaculaceae bacterium]
MKKLFLSLLLSVILGAGVAKADSALTSQVILTPYVEHDASTPKADKILLDKLNRIVTKYGVGSSSGLQSPFIITGHAIELNKETTATVPPRTAVDLSLTLYIGNGEEGIQFSTCNMNLRGVGSSLDDAYAAAFKRIDINDPQLTAAIDEGRVRIAQYYEQQGPALIRKAEAFAAAGNYADAYGVLLRIPPVCPQYAQAQNMVIELVGKESDANNGDVIAKARAAWSASPDESGAAKAQAILAGMSNASPKMRSQADALMKEMSTRLQKVDDAARAADERRDANAHAERMAYINGATKVAVAQAKRPVYHIHWW